MSTAIDLYCERLGSGLWAEPLNAITNAAFFIAAFFVCRLAKSENALDWRAHLLIALIVIIGAGSTLFHTFATHWAMLSDILPILFFQIAFIGLYVRRVIGLNAPLSLGLLGVFFATIYVARLLPPETLNGSISYAPALLFVAGLGIWHALKTSRERFTLLAAAGVFILSLTLRSFDMALCETLPIGTHFWWHILNGGVLYLSARAYIISARTTP